jgi:hypothetical protein
MGIGENVRGTAENALKDLAGLSEPNDDAHVPEPGEPYEDIKVHSSISEGSNAGEPRPAVDSRDRPGAPEEAPGHGTDGNIIPSDGGDNPGASGSEAAPGEANHSDPPRGVPGPGGLPDPDPEGLRADPSEGDSDPTASTGRG